MLQEDFMFFLFASRQNIPYIHHIVCRREKNISIVKTHFSRVRNFAFIA